MIKCFNSNIEIYSDNNYNYNNWNLINNKGLFTIYNNTSNRVDLCISQTGNVGIGSTNPVSKMDVVGDVSIIGKTTISSNLVVNNRTLTTPIAQFGNNLLVQSNIYIIGGTSARIGIGSSAPKASLDILGTANISGVINANGGLTVPEGQTLNVLGNIQSTVITTETLNVANAINANGGIILPYGNALLADGGTYTSFLNASELINATGGLTVFPGSLLTANGGISATTITASGLISANNGLTIPATKVLTANGGISATNIETSGTILAKTATLTTPVVQFGSNVSASSNIYFVGGGRARIGIGSSAPTASLDVLGNANISGAINANTIGVVAGISANSLSVATTISANSLSTTTTMTAGGIITANAGITVPSGSRITADGGIVSTTISASGMITATNGITANTINSLGLINTVGGIISDSTITSFGLISANAGLNASTITSLGIINADAGISATTISSGTIQTTGLIQTQGGLSSTTITASGLITANNGVTASSINSLGTIVATNAVSTAPLVQIGTNANSANNLYFVGGGNARIGIGSSSPSVSLDVVGLANISGRVSANDGISTTTINASGLITAPTLNVLSNIVIGTSNATIPITQIGTNVDTASNIYFIGGGTSRIGIGVSSPSYAMEIAGDTNITGIYRKNNRDVFNDTSNYVLSTSNLISTRLNDHFPYTWRINSYTSNLYYSLGNVGIGVTEPVKKLHIRHPSNELLRIESATEGANQVSGIEFGIPSYNTATRSKITSTTYVGNASDLQFSTVSSINNSTPQLIISPYGCVGIGTPNPLNILQIGSGGRLRIANNNNDYTVIGTADADDITNTKIELSGRTRTGSQGAVSGEISYVTTTINGHHRFITSSATEKTERMRITSAGNVGIGTTTPEELLTLYGSNTILKIKNSLDSGTRTSVAINLENGSNSSWIICNSNNSLSFDFNNSNRITIEGTRGNIGIGTKPYDSGDSGSASDYILNILGNVRVGGNIVPASSNIYNLGSATNKWKNLYLSGNSIYLDDLVLSRDSNINLNVKDLLGNYKDACVSNIQLNNNSSNTLKIGIDGKGNIVYSTSNKIYYPVTTTNINNTEILDNVNKIILDTSNYAIETSNILSERITTFNNRQSNYVLSTSNLISKRITELTTDMINENIDGKKKFIINHMYNDDLLINGTLTINSNLIVLGENTLLETTVYTTERMEIVNENNTSVALMVKQADIYTDIFVASNLTTDVFKITNNGDVHINGSGNYMKNNRDVFNDTSNYIQSTSNNLINYANRNDINNSNYTTVTSNILYNNIAYVDSKLKLLTLKVNLNDSNTSNYIYHTSNTLINKADFNDNNSSNYTLATSNTLINKADFNDNNSSNYTLATSNTLINKADFNDNNSSNYTLATSNTLIAKANFNDNNSSNYTLATSNTLINKADFNDNNSSNYTLATSNTLINKADFNDNNSSNYTLATSNTLIAKANFNDNNSSNYTLATSNTLINKADFNDNNSSNYTLATSNTLIAKANFNDNNSSNYTLATSNIISKRITDLTTDMITEKISASNKFIVNNVYNNNLELNGSLTINSNLIVLGDTTRLEAVTYTTERLEIVNADNTTTAFMVQQKTNDRDIFVASNLNTDVFRIANNGDVHINGSGVYKRNNRDVILDTSNYTLATSNTLINKADFNDNNSSNYTLATSNTLINKADFNDNNSSNYTLATSNTLIAKANFNDNNSSNYTLATSNTLINKANLNDLNASNYTLATSNTLINKADFNDNNSSNYTLATSNTLINKADFNDNNSSNYTLATSNTLINKADFNDNNSSNYTLATSNTLINKADFNDNNSSNYTLATSNIISKRITDLTTDMITEEEGASNKFIVNNRYNNNLELNGTLTINSNLIVLGDTTRLEAVTYTTERLEIVNADNTTTAFMVQQKTNDRDIFVASNLNTDVFRIANNGDVHINGSGVYKRNNRDVILDTSNYTLATSNTLINKADFNDNNSSNYTLATSNTLIAKANFNDNNSSNYTLATSNTLIAKANFNDLNASNYTLATSNTLINKANFNDLNASNYTLATSNIISKRITDLTTDMITEEEGASNKFIVNNRYNNNLELNGTLTINSNLIVLGDTTRLEAVTYTTERLEVVNANNTTNAFMVQQNSADRDIFVASNMDTAVFRISNNGDVLVSGAGVYKRNNRDVILDTSNYVLATSNTLVAKANFNDLNASNYVLATSNTLVAKANFNDLNASNYVLATSNTLVAKANFNDRNASNYVLATSNLISKRITELTTDMITEEEGATNKFIVNNVYNNNLELNGSLTINSNLIVLGDTTRLEAIVYSTERLEVINENNTTRAMVIQQKSANSDIFVASNMDTAVFRIANNGDVHINGAGVYKKNDRDVIWDTSNYVSAIEESLIGRINNATVTQINYITVTSSNLGDGLSVANEAISINDINTSNYVYATSNIIQKRINEITTDKIVEGAKNRFIIENRYNSNLLVQGNLVVSSNLVVNQLATLNNSLNITGDVNFTGDIYKNGMIYPNGKTYTGSSSILSQYSPIQTQFNMYKNVVEKTGVGWQFIDNNINVVDDKVQGFCVRIKPNHYSSKLLINLNCHIGIDYGTDARWWGLRLYRKIGEAGEWTHISGADGTDYNNNNGTTCWLSHNLGAESSTYSYFIANISGAYYDIPGISEDYIYYTVKWCSLLGDNTQNGKLYLNRPAVISSLNAPVVSSSWNISEIWQLETSYFPKGGIVTKYTPTQTQFNIYKNVVEKTGGGWQFIDNDTSITNNNIAGFCVRIRPSHYSSKILINLTCHIGIDYGTDARWWGLRLYRKIGEGGAWTHIADADGSGAGGGTPCWLSHNLGAESSTYSYFIANVSGAYYDVPNAMDTYVYYTVQWCSQLGDATQNGKLYLNRPATYNNANGANSAVLSSSWNAQEIWQLETTFIPKNAVICQNMSIQTLFNIYRNIVIKSGNGWQFIDNNTNIINDKIQGFCVRIKPTHPSSKVLVHISCHIGIDYGTDARWWGLRLYRKIGEGGTWTHITDADGNNLIDNQGTSCWLSHNLGAESSTSSYFVANISGSFFDLPGTSSDFVYYTAKWCSILGDNSQEGKIYLNRPATYNDSNSAVLSSSWNAQEIWQLGTPYEPAEYSIINIFNNNNVGIGTTNPVSKLDVNGTINAVNYSTISDRRYKKDIKAVDSSLELINKLDPVSYLTIEQNEGERRNFGFIAQDLHSLIPEAVNVPLNDNNNYTIEYMSLIPLLTKSIQELTEKINRQQATIDYLSSRLHD